MSYCSLFSIGIYTSNSWHISSSLTSFYLLNGSVVCSGCKPTAIKNSSEVCTLFICSFASSRMGAVKRNLLAPAFRALLMTPSQEPWVTDLSWSAIFYSVVGGPPAVALTEFSTFSALPPFMTLNGFLTLLIFSATAAPVFLRWLGRITLAAF